MAPLAATAAATLAATVAVRVGAALARAERDRRGTARKARDRRFGLLHGEPAAEGLRRIALGQLDLVLERLEGEQARRGAPGTVHEVRKALKRLRALMRLLEDALGERAYAQESAALRDAGRRLAGARDSEVTVSTLEGLLARERKLSRLRAIAEFREQLVAERDRAELRTSGAADAELLGDLRGLRARVCDWRLPEKPGTVLAEPGLGRIYRQGRRRYRRALGGKGDRARAMHEWRKRVKDLRYAAEALDRQELEDGRRARGGKRGARRRRTSEKKAARSLSRVARRADELGEVLGEEHDLTVLAARVRVAGLPRRPRKRLLKAIARRRRRLRRRALREGERLYRSRPKKLVDRARRAEAARARALSRR